jgi:hypothetical protein
MCLLHCSINKYTAIQRWIGFDAITRLRSLVRVNANEGVRRELLKRIVFVSDSIGIGVAVFPHMGGR